MGSKYTVEAGIRTEIQIYYETNYLLFALWSLLRVKINKDTIYWKRLTIR